MTDQNSNCDQFGKNDHDESFLNSLNDELVRFERALYKDSLMSPPIVHIVGLPRSGTTLLTQIIASGLKIGYVSNLVAAFWRAPVTGIKLARKLAGDYRPDSFVSSYGRTTGLHNPHEFGYFWREILGYDDMIEPEHSRDREIDWNFIRVVLGNISHEFGCPVLFKSFLMQWHIRQAMEVMPNTCFIRIRRNPIEAAVSLIGMRERYFGDRELWVSLKPKEYSWLKDLPYWEQVAGQVFFLEQSLERNLAEVNSKQVMNIELSSLQRKPESTLQAVHGFLSKNNAEVDLIHRAEYPDFCSNRTSKNEDVYRKVEKAYDGFLSGRFS